MQESLGEAYPGHIRYEHDALNSAFGSPAQHAFFMFSLRRYYHHTCTSRICKELTCWSDNCPSNNMQQLFIFLY